MIFDPTGVNYVMNTLQAASYLGVPTDLIESMVEKGTIPFTKVGDRSLREDLPSLGFQSRKAG